MSSATMSSRVLGIDFGTTNTVVAVVMEDGGVEVLANDIGNRTTPSVVHIDPTDPSKHQVGEAALRLGVGEPLNTIRNVKRILGYPPEAARCITALGPVKVITSEHGEAVSLKLSGDTKTTPEEVVAEQHKKEVADTRSEEILRSLWVGAKVKLSRLPQTNIQTYLPEIETEFRKLLTQTEFNSECSDLFQHITTAINGTLKKAQVEANKLDDVILVGGSTRIVKLRELIIGAVGGGVKLHKAVNPDEVVALGAALLGGKCVQIKREVLGLHTYMTILDSDKQETNEHWAHSTALPVSFAFKSLSMTNSKDLEMKQGHETKTLMTVCRLPIPQKAESITINTQGTFSFRDAGKNKLCSSYLRGCLPEVTLESLKVKMQSQVKSSLVEAGRVEAKNALEDVLRQGKSWETSEDEPFPEKYSAYREMCIEKLVWLDNHADFEREEFDKIRVELEEVILSLQEESKKERHRVQEIEALTELLNKAINIEVVNDEFEERATGLRKSCQEEKEWLSENCHFSSEEYTTRKDKVNQAITALNEDRQKAAIQKLRNQLREHLQQRLRGMIKFATEKKKIKDPLDYQWGTKLETICRRTTMWLKDHSEASEDELNHRTTQLERDNNILDGEIQQLKQKRDCERKAAYKNAEQTVLQGVYLKVAEFEAVSSDALKFVEMCKDYLERLKKNPHMNASDCAKLSSEVEKEFLNLRSLCMAENNRRQSRKSLQSTLETTLKDGEPLRTFAQGFLTWLEQNPTAAKEQLEEVMASVRDARGSLQEADKLAEAAVTQRERATQTMERQWQKLGLQPTTALYNVEVFLFCHLLLN
ncbi:hypothetical protein FOCC_FOCC000025 [Frankliniella occidentalis]|nr:hypothetical protein FOCC_FOCC000025 [Frankliniella occidentalis]